MYKLLSSVIVAIFLASSNANIEGSCLVDSLYTQLNNASTSLRVELLYKQVTDQPSKTFATSPLPALVTGGEMGLHAEGDSYKEILKLLNLDDTCQIKDAFQCAMSMYTSENVGNSKLTCKIYDDKGISFSNHFKKEFREIFHGETENIDASKPVQAADKINDWVSNQSSQNNIQNVISDCEIHKDSGLYVVCAQKLVVDWNNPFIPQGITEIDFHNNNNEIIRIPSLTGDGYLNHAEYAGGHCQFLELPIKGDNMAVLVIRPTEVDGLATCLAKLRGSGVFNKVYNSMRRRCITINLPLGEVHDTIDMKQSLIAAKYHLLFDPKTANLKGISKKNKIGLYISQFRHVISIIGNAQVGNTTDSSSSNRSSDHCCEQSEKLHLDFNYPFGYLIMGQYITIKMGGVYSGNT